MESDMPDGPYSYSSTQFNLPVDLAQRVKEESHKIPNFALHGDGRETKPHVTIKYGLHTGNPDNLRKVLAGHPKFRASLGDVSHFPDTGHGDVVKVDVHSPKLHELNAKIAKHLEHTDTHKGYKPHITLGYVKPGLGPTVSKKIGKSLSGSQVDVDHVVFSSKDGKKTRIPLSDPSSYKMNNRGDH